MVFYLHLILFFIRLSISVRISIPALLTCSSRLLSFKNWLRPKEKCLLRACLEWNPVSSSWWQWSQTWHQCCLPLYHYCSFIQSHRRMPLVLWLWIKYSFSNKILLLMRLPKMLAIRDNKTISAHRSNNNNVSEEVLDNSYTP